MLTHPSWGLSDGRDYTPLPVVYQPDLKRQHSAALAQGQSPGTSALELRLAAACKIAPAATPPNPPLLANQIQATQWMKFSGPVESCVAGSG